MLLDTQLIDDLRKIAHDIKLLGSKYLALEKAVNTLDLQSLEKNLQLLVQSLENTKSSAIKALDALRDTAIDETSDTTSAYAASLQQECQRLGLSLQNHFPEYILPPLSVKIDVKGKCARVGTRTITSLEPKALAKEIHKIYRRIGADFNPERFANALIVVYDAITGGENGRAVPLRTIYEVLTARSGAREYPLTQFSSDISLLRQRTNLTHNNRRLRFSQPYSRGADKAIPVYDATGERENLSAIVIENTDHNAQQATLPT